MFGGARRRIANCHSDLLVYHARRVALRPSGYDALRSSRDKVRLSIKRRLKAMGYRQPMMIRGQGSVAMRTVTRGGYYGVYDIDDGIYFARSALTGPLGGELSPLAARERIWEAAYSEKYISPPERHKNCVRVHYKQGFHIDFPVYRITTRLFAPPLIEIASSTWKVANPNAVTAWFAAANERSPGLGASRQLARMVRYLKHWCRSRYAWQGRMPSGFAITKLVVECYRAFPDRDDRALLHLLAAIHGRLCIDTVVAHPVIKDEYICGPNKDATTRFLRQALEVALARLGPLTNGANRQAALALWDSFFNDDFFSSRPPVIFI
jgi:hypothetical protein